MATKRPSSEIETDEAPDVRQEDMNKHTHTNRELLEAI